MVFLRWLIIFTIFIFIGCSNKSQRIESIVKESYIKSINNTNILEKRDNKLKLNLDKYSKILKNKDMKTLQLLTSGRYRGVGIILAKNDRGIYILETIKNSQAEKKGIKKFDKILKINNYSTTNMSISELARYIKSQNKPFKLTLQRTTNKIYNITLQNSQVKIPLLKIKKIDDTLYIKISSFKVGLVEELKNKLSLVGIKRIVFDLRDNRGGIFNESIKLADMFLQKGTIVVEKYRNKKKIYKAHDKSSVISLPLIVIVNQNTASASEIFTGAMKYNKRAKIIGSQTFGKGTIQKMIQLDDKTLLKITVAKYYLPNGKNIDGIGISPDVKLNSKTLSLEDEKILTFI